MNCEEDNGDGITPRSSEIKSVVCGTLADIERCRSCPSQVRVGMGKESSAIWDASITVSGLNSVVWRFLVRSLDQDRC